eukprot:TRINITY_DN474_c0_g1_i10.p2 TRINITY_DN474_c0_g1~~TRINITY_DN474_c0_g1_i10.p2  ORF type:complete len:242 (-),score=-65.59 TRINITY_DN474_c0_g1_i10:20-745(-)
MKQLLNTKLFLIVLIEHLNKKDINVKKLFYQEINTLEILTGHFQKTLKKVQNLFQKTIKLYQIQLIICQYNIKLIKRTKQNQKMQLYHQIKECQEQNVFQFYQHTLIQLQLQIHMMQYIHDLSLDQGQKWIVFLVELPIMFYILIMLVFITVNVLKFAEDIIIICQLDYVLYHLNISYYDDILLDYQNYYLLMIKEDIVLHMVQENILDKFLYQVYFIKIKYINYNRMQTIVVGECDLSLG